MIVISDTSPVLNLARIGRLQLLPLLYKEGLIPLNVFEELTGSERGVVPAIDLVSMPWLRVVSARDQQRSGLIKKAKPVLDELIQIARFWIGHDLYSEVLAELGEV